MGRPNSSRLVLCFTPVSEQALPLAFKAVESDQISVRWQTLFIAPGLCRGEFERAVSLVHADGLPFSEFAFEKIEAEAVEDFFGDRALQRSRSIHWSVTFAGNKRLRVVAQFKPDLLFLQTNCRRRRGLRGLVARDRYRFRVTHLRDAQFAHCRSCRVLPGFPGPSMRFG